MIHPCGYAAAENSSARYRSSCGHLFLLVACSRASTPVADLTFVGHHLRKPCLKSRETIRQLRTLFESGPLRVLRSNGVEIFATLSLQLPEPRVFFRPAKD